MTEHQELICAGLMPDGLGTCSQVTSFRRMRNGPAYSRGRHYIGHDWSMVTAVVTAEPWAHSQARLRMIMAEGAWSSIKDNCLTTLEVPRTRHRSPVNPLILAYTKEVSDLALRISTFGLIIDGIVEGIQRANTENRELKVEFMVDSDVENASWRQIAVEIIPLAEIDDDTALSLWELMETEIRPSLKKILMEHAIDLEGSPVEISNENISIRVNW